ncbi:MAG: AAA family ATPase [Candidatus Accumulibacter phosphatis]|uniref:AAA family ATPase n=1 Tax=Candidatus Accumulibacter sp. ACC012 TaxID=2823332 RepID=UPI0025C35A48|nr:AAA family ATPase [Candidatus Accumulibacter sp. ACC012]
MTVKGTVSPSKSGRRGVNKAQKETLTAISVVGYKSLTDRQRMEIRPLTVLAGANSGGKSSIMQPILLLKQTIDSPYDSGSLLLGGPNVRLTSATQLLSKISSSSLGAVDEFSIDFEIGKKKIGLCFRQVPRRGLEIFSNSISDEQSDIVLTLENEFPGDIQKILSDYGLPEKIFQNAESKVVRDRCFLAVALVTSHGEFKLPSLHGGERLASLVAKLIHVPGLRGNPERNYKTTAVGDSFPGTFENYVASVIQDWQTSRDGRMSRLNKQLENLGLTWKVMAEQKDETQVELKVGRLPHGQRGGAHDLVSIADVGFGVSQALPVLVALLAAEPGQLVYVEQPEIHLHPSAQRALATVLSEAARRGVIVIVETHSALLLRGIQTLVAKDELPQELVKLHWFQRDKSGKTSIVSSDLDESGAFGDWPEDFDEVELDADNEYLSAAEEKLFRNAKL